MNREEAVKICLIELEEINSAMEINGIAERALIIALRDNNTTRLVENEMYIDSFAWICEECGETFAFIEGSPHDNNYKYCCNCGRRIIEYVEYREED